jgi:glutamate carboxypeptidase
MDQYKPYLEWIENYYPRSLKLVREWSNINSFTSNTEGLAEMARVLQRDFSPLGGEQTLIPLAPRKVLGSGGKTIEIPVGNALQIRKRPKAPIQVFLAGHMDTVYPPSSLFQRVEEINATTWKGPGVTDMKGGLVIMLTALSALENTPLADQIGWEVLINPDEEVGSVSSAYLFEQAAKRHQVGLIFEPAFSDGAFVSGRKGSATYTIIARGKAAHSGRDFSQGRSAIYALSQFMSELELTNHPESGFSVNVGFVEGGGPVNIVPDFALCKVNIRSTDSEKIQNFIHHLNRIADQCRKREGIQIEVHADTERLPKPFDKKTQILFNQFAECAGELKIAFQLRESGGVCDGNILSQSGLPTIDSLGVVGGQIHTHEEFIVLPSLVERAKLTLLFLLKQADKERYV